MHIECLRPWKRSSQSRTCCDSSQWWTGLLRAALLWSYFSGYGLILLSGAIVAYSVGSWRSVAYLVIAIATGFVAELVLELLFSTRQYKRSAMTLSSVAETNVISAVCLHLSQVGLPVDLTVTQEDLDNDDWKCCLFDYASK